MQRVPFRSLAALLVLGGVAACGADRVVGNEAVEFNVVMQFADFEDGPYVYAPQPPEGEHIYLASPDGSGTPTLLTRGGWPSWFRVVAGREVDRVRERRPMTNLELI